MTAIDRAALDAQTGGDADLAREVLALFAGQCRALLPRLTDPARPPAERADLAHTLKGSAAGVGAARVQALAGAAEAALRAAGDTAGDTAGDPGAGAAADPAGAVIGDLAEAAAAALAEIAG